MIYHICSFAKEAIKNNDKNNTMNDFPSFMFSFATSDIEVPEAYIQFFKKK